MIVEGNAPLAASYAANIIAIYQTYRWNTYVDAHAKDPQVWHGPVDNATWQDGYLVGDELAEIKFWLGEGASAPAASGQPAAAQASGARKCAPRPRPGHRRMRASRIDPAHPQGPRGAEALPHGRSPLLSRSVRRERERQKGPSARGLRRESPVCEARALKTEAGPRAVGVGEYETTHPQTRTPAVMPVHWVSAAARLFRLSAFSAADTSTPPVAWCGR